jgi:hypothetical protein
MGPVDPEEAFGSMLSEIIVATTHSENANLFIGLTVPSRISALRYEMQENEECFEDHLRRMRRVFGISVRIRISWRNAQRRNVERHRARVRPVETGFTHRRSDLSI